MADETHKNVDLGDNIKIEVEVTQEANKKSEPSPQKESAQDRLVQEVAGETSVQKAEPAIPTGGNSEAQFMDFVAEKSQELPQEQVVSIPETGPGPLAEPEPEIEKRLGIVRTYHTDVAETIRDRKLSLANIAVAEKTHQSIKKERKEKRVVHAPAKKKVVGIPEVPQAAKPEQQAEKVKEKKEKKQRAPINWRRLGLNITSVVLVIAGVGILAFLYLQYQDRVVLDPSVPTETIALANHNLTIDVTDADRDTLLGALTTTALEASGTLGDVVNVSLVAGVEERIITARELLEILEADSDPAFLRSVEDPFMLGIHLFDKPHFFLILKTSFFENAFAGMLRWEDMIADELSLLVRDVPEQASLPGSTTTPSEIPESGDFTDIIIANKDVRARLGESGEIDMLYTFTDPETLIITTNPETLEAILSRLTIARFK